jgi:hypothetical protein
MAWLFPGTVTQTPLYLAACCLSNCRRENSLYNEVDDPSIDRVDPTELNLNLTFCFCQTRRCYSASRRTQALWLHQFPVRLRHALRHLWALAHLDLRPGNEEAQLDHHRLNESK